MSNVIGLYIRTSTVDKQVTGAESQEHALKEYCKNHSLNEIKVYRDRISGGKIDRPGIQKLQQDIFVGKVKTVIVWKLDRLSRSLKDGINLLVDWLDQGVRVVAVSQQFDFSGAVGKLIASVLLGIAEMERQNIRENIVRGMENAKKKGVKIGGSEAKIHKEDILTMKKQGMSMKQIAGTMNCSRQALYLAMKRN